ncbi:hypothetical protein FPHYL_10706 [Fusarium phyllophilum]|uniref:Uncharacterized protein n=1 Tax=Fusarium phyllophilum TaxID=47803 RepID=A0A8H5IYC6_9HYPO|nr:hypothetical protein FPHYL_10706 [Fusarium phyllophilum]
MSDSLSILEGDGLVPTNDIPSETSLPKANPLEQTVTTPSLPSSQSEDTSMAPYYSNLPLGLQPSVVVPREDVPPGHVRLLGGFMCPVGLTEPKEELKEDSDAETSVYHCPVGILEPEDVDEFPGEHFPDDEQSKTVLSPIGPKRPMLYLRDNLAPVASDGHTSSPFQDFSTLYQHINSTFPQSVGPEHLQPVDPQTRLRMTPHHAMNPPSSGFVQPIASYHPKPIVPGFPQPIGPPSAHPMIYYHPESVSPHGQVLGSPPIQHMVLHHATPNNSYSVQSPIPKDWQAVAVGQRQRISSLGEMLSGPPKEDPTPKPSRRRSTITFNPQAIVFTPSPTKAGLIKPGETESALSPTDAGMNTYDASEFTHNPADIGMSPYEETGVEGFIAPAANAEATMVDTLQDTYKKILAIEDERDREDAINEFYYMQAKPWTDEMTRLEKEQQELEERKRRFARK